MFENSNYYGVVVVYPSGYRIVRRRAADGHTFSLLSPKGVSVARERTEDEARSAAAERGVGA